MQPICLFLQQYHQPLAVPSDGSNLRQRLIATIDKLQRKRLQYPQTGRTSGNTYGVAKADVLVPLAVPSDGSNLRQLSNSGDPYQLEPVLQYPQTGGTSCNPAGSRVDLSCQSPCSTLRRVEPQATHGAAHR